MGEFICIDVINTKSIFISEKGAIYYSDQLYEIGESEDLESLKSINLLSAEEQLQIKTIL